MAERPEDLFSPTELPIQIDPSITDRLLPLPQIEYDQPEVAGRLPSYDVPQPPMPTPGRGTPPPRPHTPDYPISDIPQEPQAPTQAEQEVIDAYTLWANTPNRKVVGKKGTADEGLNFYSKVPGQMQLVNGQWWIQYPEEPDRPAEPFTANHAVNWETGQIYEQLPDVYDRATFLPAGVNQSTDTVEPAMPGFMSSALQALARAEERIRFGIDAHPMAINREARDVAGLAMVAGTVPTLTKEGAEVLARGARPAATPDVPTVQPAPTPQQPQYRVTPTDVAPRGHITTRQLADRRAREAAETEARRLRETPEVDEAGFYVHALEQARLRLPERATAAEMRQHLTDLGVEAPEAAMLGLDNFLLGPVGGARAAVRSAAQDISRMDTALRNARAKLADHPGNSHYESEVQRLTQAVETARTQFHETRTAARQAEEAQLGTALQNFRNAEAHLKTINAQIRDAKRLRAKLPPEIRRTVEKQPLEGEDIPDLYVARAEARRQLEADRKALEDARSVNPGDRMVGREHLVTYLRQARPRLAFEVREFPAEPYGAMTGPINRILNPTPENRIAFRDALVRRGVEQMEAESIVRNFRNANPPEWGQRAAARSDHMRRPGVVREALEEAAGAPLNDMVSAWRGSSTAVGDVQLPKYRQSIPDEDNPTLREVAVILQGPWSQRRDITRQIQRLEVERSAANRVYNNAASNTPESIQAGKTYTNLSERIADLHRERDALPETPFTSGHWDTAVSPVGHMQLSMQRAPEMLPPVMEGASQRLTSRIDKLTGEINAINRRIDAIYNSSGDVTRAMYRQINRLSARRGRIEKQIQRHRSQLPTSTVSEDQILMGNQFQSDWAGQGTAGFRPADAPKRIADMRKQITELENKAAADNQRMQTLLGQTPNGRVSELDPVRRRQFDVAEQNAIGNREDAFRLQTEINALKNLPSRHDLVLNMRAWLRPVLEQFLEMGIRSGARYLGLPSGATVAAHNPGLTPGTISFYNKALRDEMRFVMERRERMNPIGLKYTERDIRSMFNPAGNQSFPGHWRLIELPQTRRPARGVRLMSEPAAGAAGLLEDRRDEGER